MVVGKGEEFLLVIAEAETLAVGVLQWNIPYSTCNIQISKFEIFEYLNLKYLNICYMFICHI